MFPGLIEVAGLSLSAYKALILFGGALCCAFLGARRTQMGLRREYELWLLILAMAGGAYFGGRILYLLEYVPQAPHFWAEVFSQHQGFSILGAFFGVPIAAAAVAWLLGVSFLAVLDHICVVAPFWHFFGRLGCLCAGCCFGTSAPHLPWAVVFTDARTGIPEELLGQPLHPVQLYEGLLSLAVGIALYKLVLPRTDAGRFAPGVLAALYLVAYALIRSCCEMWRGDAVQLPALGITAAQTLCVGLLLGGIGLLVSARHSSQASSLIQSPSVTA